MILTIENDRSQYHTLSSYPDWLGDTWALMTKMKKRVFQLGIVACTAASLIAVGWLGFALLGYCGAGAFHALEKDAGLWMLLWFGCAGTSVCVTWNVIEGYRRAFPKRGMLAVRDRNSER